MTRNVFDPDVVHECALRCLGKPKPQMFDALADALEERYPGEIDRGQPWIYSIAGGAMIQMKLYFASPHEYVMVWGTPIRAGGFSGRHFVGFWDTVIDGETWYYAEGQFERTVYKPGDRIYVGPGHARMMDFTTGVWAVEYARGPIPLSLPFGLADLVLSCLDFPTVAQTVTLYTDLVCQHLGRELGASPTPLAPIAKHVLGAVAAAARHATARLTPPAPLSEIPRDTTPWCPCCR